MLPASGSAQPKASRLQNSCQALSFALPWGIAVAHASAAPSFATDIALLRSFGMLPIGAEGWVSAGLGTAFGLLPIGGKVLRASFAAALSLGLSGLLIFRISRHLFRQRSEQAPLREPLALLSALAATLSPAWTLEGSAPGGSALGAALALAALLVTLELGGSASPRRVLALGALLGLTALESRSTAVALGGALLIEGLAQSKLPNGRQLGMAALAFGATALLPLALLLAFWFSEAKTLGFVFGFLRHGMGLSAAPVEASRALSAWMSEMGLISVVLALFGFSLGLRQPRSRGLFLALLVFLAADLAFDAAHTDSTQPDPWTSVRLLSLAVLAASSTLGLSAAIEWLSRARVLFARPVSVLLVVYAFTLVLVSAEDASAASDERESGAAEYWTDEALASLPPNSALLVRSEPILFRLLATRSVRGDRPDLLIAPLSVLEAGGVSSHLFARERDLLPLVREALLSGRPNEYTLSALADLRPTFVELDPASDFRLISHLAPQGLFTAFAAQPLARSDRRERLTSGERALSRLQRRLHKTSRTDQATRTVLADTLGQSAVTLAALGDREVAADWAEKVLKLDPHSALGLKLRERLQTPGKGRLDVSGLYALR